MRCLLTLFLLPIILTATPYAGEFQDLGGGSRACGMAGTGFAQGIDPSAIYFNPALTRLLPRSLFIMHAESFGGLVRNEYAAAVVPRPAATFGIGLQYLAISGIKFTTLPDTTQPPSADNPPYPYDTVSAQDAILYGHISRGNEFLGWGGNLKLYYRGLSAIYGFGGGIDLGGTLNLEYVRVGVSVRDFILAPLVWSNGTKETIFPRFTLAVAPILPIPRINSRFTLECAVQKQMDLPGFSIRTGAEFAYHQTLYGRCGISPNSFTLGAGLRYRRFFFDYALATHSYLKNTNKFSAGIEF